MMLDKLNWRYAVKKMDPTRSVPEEKVEKILEAIRFAPTSSGVQPFEVFVVTNPALREKIREASFGQPQITEGSHLLVFAAWDNYTAERIDAVLEQTQKARGASETLAAYYERLKGMYLPRTEEVNHDHAARQAYIAFGFALAAAAELEVDSTPMEGFDPAKVDEILGLREKGLRSVTLLPLGVRAEEGDWLQGMAKVRKPADELFTVIA
ncbi:nitroreductase family protein [Poseidonocella sp. HB161398]|uniref:nitroreductase family protein n=1 Tax=Poseidonocella sp. HB161398 TaxID=2320855 RepID=UPI0014868352|nr:nitroreductase family protein [Poseidonocella sp. HB161398]